ncbi:MAG: hypothetical protein ACRBN8_40260 [Nannocystales bacterium]
MPRRSIFLRGLFLLLPVACNAEPLDPFETLDPGPLSFRAAADVLQVIPELDIDGVRSTPVEPYVRKQAAGAMIASDLLLRPGATENGLELNRVSLMFTGSVSVPNIVLNRDDIGVLLRERGSAFHALGTNRHPPADGGPPIAVLTHGLRVSGGMYGIGRGADPDAAGYLVWSNWLGSYRDSTFLYPNADYDEGSTRAIIRRTGSPDKEVFVAGVVETNGTVSSVLHRFRVNADDELEQVDWPILNADPRPKIDFALEACVATEVSHLAWDETQQKLYAAGVKRCGSERVAFVARFMEDGTLDGGYGVNGIAELAGPGGVTADPGGLVLDEATETAWVALGVSGACEPELVGACDTAVVKLDAGGAVDATWGLGAATLQPGWVKVDDPTVERAAPTGVHRDAATGAVTVVGWADRGVSTDFMAARFDGTGLPDPDFGPDATDNLLFAMPTPGDDLRTAGLSPSGVPHFVAEREADDGRTRLVVQRHIADGSIVETSTSLAQEGMRVGSPFFNEEALLVPGGVEGLARGPAHSGPSPIGAAFTRFRADDFLLDWGGVLEDGTLQQVAWPDAPDLPSPWPSELRVSVGFSNSRSTLDQTVALVEPPASYVFPLNHEELVAPGWHPQIDSGAHHNFRAHHRGSTAQVYALDMGAQRWRPSRNASYHALACPEALEADPENPNPLACSGSWSALSNLEVVCPPETFDGDKARCNEREAEWGMPVRAMADGVVIGCWKNADENVRTGDKSTFFEQDMPGGGNIVYVLHEDNTIGLYAHMIPPSYDIDPSMFLPRSWNSLSSSEKQGVKQRTVERAEADPNDDLDPNNLEQGDFEDQQVLDVERELDRLRETIDALDAVCVVEQTEYDAETCHWPFDPVGNGMVSAPAISVEAGQVLGALGNSGNSSGPHVHVHVQQGFTDNDCGILPPEVPTDYQIGMPMPFTVLNRLDDTPWGPSLWDVSWGDEAVPPPVTDEDGAVSHGIRLRWHEG